jgi:phage-related protein
MSDILNFMNENSTFQSLLAGQTEREEDYRSQIEQLDTQKIMSGIESIPIAGEFFSKVKDLYGKVSDFADNVQSNVESLTSGAGETVMNPASLLDGIGSKISSRMNTSAFERDPEADFVGDAEGESGGLIDSLQSMFRGGIPVPESISNAISNVQNRVSGAIENAQNTVSGAVENVQNTVSGAVENAQNTVSELQTTVETGASSAVEAGTGAVEGAAGAVEGAVAGAAEAGTTLLGVAGAAFAPLALAAGLGYSLYDAFKKAPPPPMDFTFAQPNFTAGI